MDGYEHAYMGKKTLEDKHYGLSGNDAVVKDVDGQLWACNFLREVHTHEHYYFPDTRTGGGENNAYPKNSNGSCFSYIGNTYVKLGFNDTCYVYFGCTGSDSDI